MQQFYLGVGQFDKHDRHAMIRLILRRTDLRAKRPAVLRGGCLQIRHGDGDVVQTTDHENSPWMANLTALSRAAIRLTSPRPRVFDP
jgi:hypothetical protein